MKKILTTILTSISGIIFALSLPLAAKAASTVVVTPEATQGWSTSDTRPGGTVQYVYDPSSPLPTGALELITDNTTTSKAQYMHTANTPLANVTALGYSTKQITASSPTGDPSYQLPVCLSGISNSTCNGFTTLVYEPYWNGTVTPGTWQTWDVMAGQFWSSRTYTDSNNAGCTVTAGGGGAPFYTISQLQAACPNAVVGGFGVNVGSNNPEYVVEADGVNFNDTTYDFQLTNAPTNTDQCKNGGYVNYTDENGNAFKNQGQCVAYVNRGSKVQHFSINSVRVQNNNNQNAEPGNANNSNNGGNANSNSNSNNSNVSNSPNY